MDKNYDFVSFRIKKDTFKSLNEIKDAYEEFCDKRFTLDDFIQELIEALSKSEPEFWDIFNEKKRLMEMLREKMESARMKKNGTAISNAVPDATSVETEI